jgi:hypothetical protein
LKPRFGGVFFELAENACGIFRRPAWRLFSARGKPAKTWPLRRSVSQTWRTVRAAVKPPLIFAAAVRQHVTPRKPTLSLISFLSWFCRCGGAFSSAVNPDWAYRWATGNPRSEITAFVTALVADLTPTATVADLAATGQYDSKANTFTANRIAVLIND